MNFENYYKKNKTFLTYTDHRIQKILSLVKDYSPKSVLDVGCGNGYLLKEIRKTNKSSRLVGIDVYKTKIKGVEIKTGDITKRLNFEPNSFDCIVLGEVIEHVPDPDFLLAEIRRVLAKGGILIVSTPNLVSWANRILVPLGIQPFFTETSSQVKLGRYFKILGQNELAQGHLKIFTHRSLQEILEKEKFHIENKFGVPFFFPFPISLIDQVLTRIVSLSSGLLYVAKKN